MRRDTAGGGGWPAPQTLMLGDHAEAVVHLSAPKQQDAADRGCLSPGPTVRLVRHAATGVRLRVLLTNL